MENSATSTVIREGIVQFCSYDGCITTLQCVCHVFESSNNLISFGTLHGKEFNFSSEGDLTKVFKDV